MTPDLPALVNHACAASDFFTEADRLGEMASLTKQKPIDRPKQIETPVFRCRRENVWPPEVWAEMQAIYAGEKA